MPSVSIMIPADPAFDLPGDPPAQVSLVRWDCQGDPPAGVEHVRFWTPMMLPSKDLLARALPRLPELEVVQLISAGADAYAGRLPPRVTLCDGRGIHGGSTAEWVLAGLLAAIREFPRLALAQVEHKWDYAMTGQLAGRRALVIGAGDVGEQIARRLAAFDVEVTMVARSARPGVAAVADLPELLPRHDIVILVVPLTGQTRGMVDAEFLARMPDGAILVNGARGPVVVTDALTAELADGRLSAVVDVTDPEPLPPDHPLWTVPGLLLTPHVAASVRGFPAKAMGLVRAQLDRYLAGRPLENVVTGDY
jgi:phosphoglycerate dehydrogenase-like enzyme